MKFEISLSPAQHALLLKANAHDKTFRSLESFARDALLAGLTQIAARDCGQRKRAVATLVTAGNAQRRKT